MQSGDQSTNLLLCEASRVYRRQATASLIPTSRCVFFSYCSCFPHNGCISLAVMCHLSFWIQYTQPLTSYCLALMKTNDSGLVLNIINSRIPFVTELFHLQSVVPLLLGLNIWLRLLWSSTTTNLYPTLAFPGSNLYTCLYVILQLYFPPSPTQLAVYLTTQWIICVARLPAGVSMYKRRGGHYVTYNFEFHTL